MLKTFRDIYTKISDYSPVSIAVVNPKQNYLFHVLDEAEKHGWATPKIFSDDKPEVAAKNAISAIASGEADILMKGDIETAVLLKAVMDAKTVIRTNRLLSHIAVVKSENFNRHMLMTDGGVNPNMTSNVLDSIILNALDMAQALEIQTPNIAMLSLVEKVTAKLPESKTAGDTVNRYRQDSRFTIEGPIALDVALSKKAAMSKGIHSNIAGETDVFIGPNITAINFMVKALMGIGNASGGGVILGAKTPIVLLSRSDNIDTKLHSIALGVLAYFHNKTKNTLE